MPNHYPAILRVNPELAGSSTDIEIIDRWTQIYKSGRLMDDYRNEMPVTNRERKGIDETVARWRSTLSGIPLTETL
ncbi:MAG: hypothetical protein GKR95_01510 [Gammaproteobacteria bacterium]|nr:hypothetical protein [Gammaproteobacteria bacterium]